MKTKSFTLWFAALGPLTLLLTMMAIGAWREYAAWSEVKPLIVAELKLARGDGPVPLPIHASDTARDRELRTASEDIEAMAHVLLGRAHSQQLSLDPSEPQDWQPMAPIAKRLLADAEPMLVKLESLLKSEAGKYYDGSGQTFDLLEISFQYACYSQDVDRALRALTLLSKTHGSTDTLSLGASLQQWHLKRKYQLYRLFAQSLEQVDWSQSQLDQISTMILKSLDIPLRLKASRDHSFDPQNMLFAYDWQVTGDNIADDIRWSMKVDSVYLRSALVAARDKGNVVIKDVDDLVKSIDLIGGDQYMRLRAGVLSPTLSPISRYYRIGWNHAPYFAFILGHVEDTRRAVIVAVAIKQFQLTHGRWPKSLEELKPLEGGLPMTLTTIGGRRFEYNSTPPPSTLPVPAPESVPIVPDAETVALVNSSEFTGTQLRSFLSVGEQIVWIEISRH